MENSRTVRLNVMLTQAFDTENLRPHTAYKVYQNDNGKLKTAPGWTLQDAITLYARLYGQDRSSIRLNRPFQQQKLPMSYHEITER